MVTTNKSFLDCVAFLHDARCLETTWDCSHRDVRAIRMKVVVDIDSGLSEWNGRTLLITLSRVFAVRFTGWGIISNECIDDWKQGLSEFLERERAALVSRGLSILPFGFIISFSSGSELEVICSDVSALVVDRVSMTRLPCHSTVSRHV